MNKNNKRANGRRAFTLIELLVVVAIISLLSSVVLSSLSGARESAQVTRTVTDFRQIETGMTLWLQSTGQNRWPHEDDLGDGSDFENLKTAVEDGELGDYLTTLPDPQFGDTYVYDNDEEGAASCATPVWYGVRIFINNVPDDVILAVNQIFDDDGGDLTCGKIKSESDALIYMLSNDSTF